MKRRRFLEGLTLGALLCAPPAAAAAPATPPAPPPAAEAGPPPPAQSCDGERAALQAERAGINKEIGDIALGKRSRKRKVSGGEVAAGVAGAAASVLLPFGVGALLGAGARAAAKGGKKKKRKPAPPQPDVPAMIDRVNSINSRLEQLGACA